MFELNNVKNKAILQDFLQKWKVECSAGSLVPMRFAIFPLHLCKVLYCACHQKLMPGHTTCCTCHAKSSQQTWRSDTPKCNLSQEMSALTSEHLWWTCLLYCTCHAKCIFEDPLQMPHACHRFWKCYKTLTFCSLLTRCTILCACHAKQHLNLQKWRQHVVFCTFSLPNVLRATACTFSTSQLPKVVRHWGVLYMFTSKCASRPQRRALVRHLNFQKWSENGVFCTFSLRNVLRATTACTFSTSQLPKVFCAFWLANVLRASTACTFSTSQLPKVLRDPGVLHILTCKCASRHNGVQFFISHLASWLRTRRFSEPTFRPSGAPNHRKNTAFRDFPTFSRICIFFLLTLSLLLFFLLIFLFSLPLPCSASHLSILSEVWLLNFLRKYS